MVLPAEHQRRLCAPKKQSRWFEETNPKVGQVRRQGKQRKALLTSSKFQTEEKTASNLSTAFTQDDWITQGAEQKRSLSPLSTPKVGSPYKGVITSPDTLHKPAKHHPGYTLLVDIPHGLKDKMERLIQAAAMRCYVPDLFWKGETGEPQISHQQAYQMYLDLPEKQPRQVTIRAEGAPVVCRSGQQAETEGVRVYP